MLIGLSDKFQTAKSMINAQDMGTNLTTERLTAIMIEEEASHHKKTEPEDIVMGLRAQISHLKSLQQKNCKLHPGKHTNEQCYLQHPEQKNCKLHPGKHTNEQCYQQHPEKAPPGWIISKPRANVSSIEKQNSNTPDAYEYTNEITSFDSAKTNTHAYPGERRKDRKKMIERDLWTVDSGCSQHMSSENSILQDYQETQGPEVILGDNSKIHSTGKGNAYVSNDNTHFLIKNVLHVLA
jgi:hypothetical protein